ncbi:receptor like protein kinase S.2-like [Hordeum vulgare subsp. vulgare]|uniref:Protein kinase domain-containing protein n=1 Tax=Hordeum vulgare subsp. vulgare TaxID=112509 RepID=A0A8I6WFU2_HORVV|nr:receptor like protein kinase S.2-like [Hordeum vulgare subsp. vulgare]
MALWTGLGQAATVAQLVGADVGGLISMIVQAAMTARQNRSECEQLARRVLMIAQLLPHVQEPEAAQPLAGLGDTLRDAHELVVSCQGRSAAYQFVMAGRTAERFREVQGKIDSYLILFPVISHIGITRRLQRIYNVLVPDDSTRDEPPSLLPQSLQLQESTELAREVLPHGIQEFTLPEIMAATNSFAPNTVIGEGGSGKVYMGRLYDGRKVAIKRFNNDDYQVEDFNSELDILSRLRHKHIICILGSCLSVSKDKRLLVTLQKKKRDLLTRWRKEQQVPEEQEGPEQRERLIVYEYMENGTLSNHLHPDPGDSTLSPVTASWKMRMDVLLGVSRAIEHLHCHANPPIIHRDIKSANILFDANWVPRLSDFGISVLWDMLTEECFEEPGFAGTSGYLDPEYLHTFRVKPASDVYSLGVVIHEVLTGKRPYSRGEEEMYRDMVSFALPIIEAGNIEDLLDRRPLPEPTPWQLHALKRVAQIARCCVRLAGKDRPAISDIVANLEMAHELICRDEPGLVDEPCLWPFLKNVEDSPDSPHASNVSSNSPDSPRRLQRIYNVLVPDDSTRDEPASPLPQSLQLQESTELAQEVLPHGIQEFTLPEIMAATNSFAPNTVIGEGGSGKVYMGRLYDGREVAIKRFNNDDYQVEDFNSELDILSRLRHKHIICILGSCLSVSKDKRLLVTLQKKKRDLLTRWRKEQQVPEEQEGPEQRERLIVYEYMENGTLSNHLHPDPGDSTLSPVTASWKMRMDVLLGVSRAIEHLHCHANPPIIHRDIKSANILFDANWVPRLSDFGISVLWDMATEECFEEPGFAGTLGYLDPEYLHTFRVMPASDVYSLGVVILEVLTGKRLYSRGEEEMYRDMVSFALPIIEAGNIEDLLDRRPLTEPTPWQLHALKRVAQIARCCVRLAGKDRPAISDIVANLEMAHELICRHEPGLVDEPCLWPFLKNVED